MKTSPHNGLQFLVPAHDSSGEESAWRALSEFYVRNTPIVFWRARGTRHNLDFIQPEVEAWLGHPEASWYLPGFWEARVHPEDRDAFLSFHRGEALEPGLHRLRYRVVSGAGEPVWIEEASCVQESAPGENHLICGLFTDIGREQKLTEEVVRISNFERERLGQELHDDFCQNLAGIACFSKMLEKQLSGDSPEKAEAAAEITRQIHEALARVRSLSHSLAPLQLEDTDLVRCLEKLCRDTETRTGVVCHPDFDESIALESAEDRMHLYRLCQEAIRNAIRHGGASQLSVSLSRQSRSECRLVVEDNGRGFPDRPASSEGLGIRLMKHRCRQFGGTLNLRNRARGGAVVECQFFQPKTRATAGK